MNQSIIAASRRRVPPRYDEPLASRLRRGLLAVAWLAGAALLLALWTWQAQSLTIWGLVDGVPVPAASTRGGRVAQLLVTHGDRIQAGAPLARLYDVDVRSRLDAAEAGLAAGAAVHAAALAKLDQDLAAVLADNAHSRRDLDLQALRDAQDLIDSRSRIMTAQQEALLAQAILAQELQAARVENALVGTELERRVALTTRGMIAPDDLVTLRQRQAYLAAVLDAGPRRSVVLSGTIRSLEDIVTFQKALPARPTNDELVRSEALERAVNREAREVLIRTYAAERLGREAEVAALRSEWQALTITSPVTGIVATILAPSGAVVAPGAPVALVVAAPANRAFAWVSQQQARFVKAGDAVRIQPGGLGRPPVSGHIIATGAAVEAIPQTVRMHFTSADLGLPVLVAIDDGDVTSGERVAIRLGGAPWWAALPW